MVTPHSITPFPAFSLTTAQFAWQHSEAWEDEQLSYFAQARGGLTAQFFAPPPFDRTIKHTPARVVGRWVLSTKETGPVGWAEVRAYGQRFAVYEALVDTDARAPSAEALSLLTSAIYIVGRADVVNLVPTGEDCRFVCDQQGFGNSAKVITLRSDFVFCEGLDPAVEVTRFATSRDEWWLHPLGAKDQQTLAYLSKRYKDPPPPKAPAMRGLLGLFFKRKKCC